jgi:DnaK suppressor protein
MLVVTRGATDVVNAGDIMADFTPEQARERLLELRDEIESVAATGADSAAIVELDQSKVGRLSRMDAMQAQAMAKASSQRRDATLRDITSALQRIDNGDYGNCIDCDEAIAARRLEFDPTVMRCIDCASKREQQ